MNQAACDLISHWTLIHDTHKKPQATSDRQIPSLQSPSIPSDLQQGGKSGQVLSLPPSLPTEGQAERRHTERTPPAPFHPAEASRTHLGAAGLTHAYLGRKWREEEGGKVTDHRQRIKGLFYSLTEAPRCWKVEELKPKQSMSQNGVWKENLCLPKKEKAFHVT